MLYILLGIIIFFSGLIVFRMKRKHLLLILLRLEFVVVSLYINLYIYLRLIGHEFFFSIIFLTFTVCEGVLGLSILVCLIRTHGNDYFNRFRIL